MITPVSANWACKLDRHDMAVRSAFHGIFNLKCGSVHRDMALAGGKSGPQKMNNEDFCMIQITAGMNGFRELQANI